MTNKEIINLASIIGYMYDFNMYPGASTFLTVVFDYDNEKTRITTNEFMSLKEVGYLVDKEISPNYCQLLLGSFAINEGINRRGIIPGSWIDNRELINADEILKDNSSKDYEIDKEVLGAYYTAFATLSNVHDGSERKPITAILSWNNDTNLASFNPIYTEDDLINYLNDYMLKDGIELLINYLKENIDDYTDDKSKEELEEKIKTWENYLEQVKDKNNEEDYCMSR